MLGKRVRLIKSRGLIRLHLVLIQTARQLGIDPQSGYKPGTVFNCRVSGGWRPGICPFKGSNGRWRRRLALRRRRERS